MIESIGGFYNNLFAIEITAFGIITAVVLVFLQLFYSQFSYRQISTIFRNIFFYLVFFISVTTVTITGMASALLALPSHSFFPSIDFNIREVLLNKLTLVVMLAAFALAMILFIVWIVINIKYLKPENILLLAAKRINKNDIARFVLKKYGVNQPQPQIQTNINKKDGYNQVEIKIHTLAVESRTVEKYECFKRAVANATDPLDPLIPIVVKALKDSDLKTVDNFCDILIRISSEFIGYLENENKSNAEWDPYDGLAEKYLKFLTDYVKILLELSEKHQLNIGKIKLLNATERVAKEIVQRNRQFEMMVLFDFWKDVGGVSISKSDEVFTTIINNYKEIIDYYFDHKQIRDNEALKGIFRSLSWLGRRLLRKENIFDKPTMRGEYGSDTFNLLLGTLLSYESEYNNNHPDSYPLLYFDAIEVITKQLLELYVDPEKKWLKSNIIDCVFVFYSFGQAAISVQNEEGAALATLRLGQLYKESLKLNAHDVGGEIADLLVRLGGHAAANLKKLTGKNFLGCRLEQYVIKFLREKIPDFNYGKELERVVLDIILPGEGDHDIRWNYVKELGKALQTNFGMNFDWRNGAPLA
jgi:hypothetical protein